MVRVYWIELAAEAATHNRSRAVTRMCLGGNGMLPNNSSAASVVREFCGWICFEERNSKGMLWHSVKGDATVDSH